MMAFGYLALSYPSNSEMKPLLKQWLAPVIGQTSPDQVNEALARYRNTDGWVFVWITLCAVYCHTGSAGMC